MKTGENVRQYLIDNFKTCWRCGQEITIENIDCNTKEVGAVCPKCGFMVEVTTRSFRLFGWAVILGLIGIAFAFAFGMIVGTW
jgi:predicted RNA-binding Zn-ribbon protein involved in translation (DUF1610 family)